ncbi:MAG: vWA domain-containing protein [Myxococcota bacterium]
MHRIGWSAAAALGLVAFAGGCKIENTFLPPHMTDVFFQVPTEKVDILFVVDDSRSMQQEQEALADGFAGFLDELDASSTNYRIGLVSTSQDASNPHPGELVGDPPVLTPDDDTVALFQERVLLGIGGSDFERGLQAAADAVWRNDGFVRNSANLVVVFVTDEDDCTDEGRLAGQPPVECYAQREQLVPVRTLVDRIRSVKTQGEVVRFGAILGPLDGSCAEAYPGTRYAAAVYEAGGAIGRICDPDWTPVLRDLGVVAVGILDQFELSHAADESTIEVTVDDVGVPNDPEHGWTYDWRTHLLTFHGESVPRRDAEIRVDYDVAG